MKNFFVSIIFCLSTLPLCAQRPFVGQILARYGQRSAKTTAEATLSRELSAENIERLLQVRAQQSLDKAYFSFARLPKNVNANDVNSPIVKMDLISYPEFEKELYPNKPFLDTPEKASNYFIARNNRAFMQEISRITQLNTQVKQLYPEMKQAQNDFALSKDRTVARFVGFTNWAAHQLSEKTDMLFIGEIHGFAEIELEIANFIERVRVYQPERKIFLFSEFLPEYYVKFPLKLGPVHRKPLKEYRDRKNYIYDMALDNNITVVGLEPALVSATKSMVVSSSGDVYEGSVWSSLEGLRFRNHKWLERIKKYREEFPDALFIVYTGSGHSMYTVPFSLAKNFPKQKTFVTVFWPYDYIDPVSELFGKAFSFPQQFIYWQNPQFAQTAGFDAFFRIPSH